MVLHQCNSILILPTVLKNRKEQENVGCPLKNHSFRVRSREQATTVHKVSAFFYMNMQAPYDGVQDVSYYCRIRIRM